MRILAILAILGACLVAPASVSASTITAIMGTGIGDADWTIGSASGVELGLRARVRGQNIQNFNGGGVYTHEVGESAGNALWNFDWSITTDPATLNSFTYRLDIDYSPTSGTDFLSFDPVNAAVFDNSFGTSATAAGAGDETGIAATYSNFVNTRTKVQNSWNLGFFDFPVSSKIFNPNAAGEYTIRLTALSGLTEVASTTITVNAVPEPSSFAVFGLAALGTVLVGRRRLAKK